MDGSLKNKIPVPQTMSEVEAWIHDDITWCADYSCPLIGCIRNPKNMANPDGPHSFAMFRETDECPITYLEQQAAIERGENTQ